MNPDRFFPWIQKVTQTDGPNILRLKGIMQAKQKPLDRLSIADLGLEPGEVQATQRVVAVEAALTKAGGEIVQGEAAVGRIADLLADAKVI